MMVTTLPVEDKYSEDNQKLGILIGNIDRISRECTCFPVESSVIITTDSFEEYMKTRTLPEQVVNDCLNYLKKFNIQKVDAYISVYKYCYVNDSTVTASVSYATIYNTIIKLYERWFDATPVAKRTLWHLPPSDTYPAILFQPHQESEINTLTRHPKTGKLLQSGDGDGLVHCSRSDLSDSELKLIETIDEILPEPQKIIYSLTSSNTCILRRVVSYHMTFEACINLILDKQERGTISVLQAISMIEPEQIAMNIKPNYVLSSNIQHSGLPILPFRNAIGNAVFPWTDFSTVKGPFIFLVDNFRSPYRELLVQCIGAIVDCGGVTSHGGVICRALGITGIVGSGCLTFDYVHHKVYTDMGETIVEGDKICIVDSNWSVGGDVITKHSYREDFNTALIDKIMKLVLPYSMNPNEFKKLPQKDQWHIASILNELKKVGSLW